jgi:outer membrane protein assembly factor BamB
VTVAVILGFGAWVATQISREHLFPGGRTIFDPLTVPQRRLRCVARTADVAVAAVTVGNGRMYVRDSAGFLAAFDARACAPRWTQPLASGTPIAGVTFAPAVDARNVYVGGADGFVRAFDARTGTLRWSSDTWTR